MKGLLTPKLTVNGESSCCSHNRRGTSACVFGLAFTGVPFAVTVVVSDHTQGAAFGSAYGVATIVFGLGLAIGPQLGGVITDAAGSFRPAFMVSVACGLLGMIAAGWVSRATANAAPDLPEAG